MRRRFKPGEHVWLKDEKYARRAIVIKDVRRRGVWVVTEAKHRVHENGFARGVLNLGLQRTLVDPNYVERLETVSAPPALKFVRGKRAAFGRAVPTRRIAA